MADEQPKPKTGFLTLAWFAPLYRRVILIVLLLGWVGWEWLVSHDQLWQFISLVMLGYGVWTFFINFDKALNEEKKKDAEPKS